MTQGAAAVARSRAATATWSWSVRSPAHEAYPGGAGYNAAKFGARAVTRALRLELLGQPVRVTEIDPGMVETEFSTRSLRRRSTSEPPRSIAASRR